jgi:hypothetical protein
VTAPRPTREQLLNLADRAERGPLSAAEAARLRAGIHALYGPRRTWTTQIRTARIDALARLAVGARRRGHDTLPVALVEAAIHRPTIPKPAEAA